MKKVIHKSIFFLVSILVLLLITACPSVVPNEQIKTYSVTIDYSDSEVVTLSVEEGETLSSLADFVMPSKSGYIFGGFKTSGGDSFGVNDPVLSELVLYVRFYKNVSNEDGSSTRIEECSDGSSSSSTKTTDEDGNVTSITENTDAEGNTTIVEVVETQNEDGSITTVTTTTDSEGNTTTQTEIDFDLTHYWISRGLKILREQYDNYVDVKTLAGAITEAKLCFEKAYEIDPSNDEAKIYSALCNLSDIATNTKIEDFVRNHLGIMNYPASLEALIKGDWFTEGEYKERRYGYLSGYIMEPVSNPSDYNYYYYRASPDESGVYGPYDTYTFHMVTKYSDAPEGFYSQVWDEYWYRSDIGEYMEHPDNLRNSKFRLDENGEYLISIYLNSRRSDYATLSNYTAYRCIDTQDLNFYYYKPIKTPVFNTQFSNNWISTGVNSGITFIKLFLANALEGNTNGLNSAIDDLYDALFGEEYENVCSKIDAINEPVTIPSWIIKSFGLDQVFGSTNVKLGKNELKLVESVLDLFKCIFEYLQSYNLDSDLSVLKVDWNTVFSNLNSTIGYVQENLGSYNASIDPIAQGFLNVRSSQKLADSKQTLLSVIDDVITAYSEITGSDSIYPQAFKDFLTGADGLGILLYEGALKLRTSLINGTKFYIPMEDFLNGRVPSSWPVSGDDYVDLGVAFTPGLFSIENIFELDQQGRPVIYKTHSWEERIYDENNGGYEYVDSTESLGKVSSAQDFKDFMKLKQEAEEQKSSSDCSWEYYSFAASLLPGRRTINSLTSCLHWGEPDDERNMYMSMGDIIMAVLYNFYYGGLEDLITQYSE
jgi:hypothetical protein